MENKIPRGSMVDVDDAKRKWTGEPKGGKGDGFFSEGKSKHGKPYVIPRTLTCNKSLAAILT